MRSIVSLSPLLLMVGTGQASGQAQVSGPLVLEHKAAAGQKVIEGVLNLNNPTGAAAQTQITLADIRSDPKLGTVYLKAGTLERSNTAWISLPSNVVTVPAHGRLTVPYRIQIPQTAATGTHWGVFLISPATPAAVPSRGTPVTGSLTLQQVTRYAVQVVVDLPGGQPRLNFQNPVLTNAASGLQLNVELTNAGERLSVPITRAEVYDAGGKLVQNLQGRQRRVYPGLTVGETYQITGLKPGKYQVLVLADDPTAEVVGARYNVTVK